MTNTSVIEKVLIEDGVRLHSGPGRGTGNRRASLATLIPAIQAGLNAHPLVLLARQGASGGRTRSVHGVVELYHATVYWNLSAPSGSGQA